MSRLVLARDQIRALQVDVIGLQEVRPLNGKDGTTTAEWLASEMGMHCHYAPSVVWQDDDFSPGHPGGQEGLAVLSRFPLLEYRVTPLPEARPTEKRILLSAHIGGAVPFWFHTTHLHYRLDDGVAREKQVVAIHEVIKNVGENPQVLCGDLNAGPSCDEIRFLRGECSLNGMRAHYQDAYARIHPQKDGYTWSSDNELSRPLRSLDIDRRIDYVFVTTRRKDGRGTVTDAQVVLTQRDDKGLCASDHYGVFAEVEMTPL